MHRHIPQASTWDATYACVDSHAYEPARSQVSTMLALGADMNALTEDSNTPLHLAIMGGSQAA